jgi:crossover junction endodeoxyribonuclease RuvC
MLLNWMLLMVCAAYCHFLQLGKPESQKIYSGWKDYIAKNQEKVKNPVQKKREK